MIKCRFFYMRIILSTIFLLFNLSTHVIACPSSGDGDCVPKKDTYNKPPNQSSTSANVEKSKINTFEFEQIDFNLAEYSTNTILTILELMHSVIGFMSQHPLETLSFQLIRFSNEVCIVSFIFFPNLAGSFTIIT